MKLRALAASLAAIGLVACGGGSTGNSPAEDVGTVNDVLVGNDGSQADVTGADTTLTDQGQTDEGQTDQGPADTAEDTAADTAEDTAADTAEDTAADTAEDTADGTADTVDDTTDTVDDTTDTVDDTTDTVDDTADTGDDTADTGTDTADTGTDTGGTTCSTVEAVVDALPFTYNGDTTGKPSNYEAADCVGYGDPNMPDVTIEFTPSTSGAFSIDLTGGPNLFSVATDCADLAASCDGAYDYYSGGPATAHFLAGTTYYLIIDGYDASETGTFTLTIDQTCTADCTDKVCGDDGCGGSCGTCDAGFACNDTGTCEDVSTVPGNMCTNPIALDVATLPSTSAEYDTSGMTNDFTAPANVCDGLTTSDKGTNAPDMVFSLTPETAGVYTISLVSDWDGIIYLATTCDDVANTCVVYGDSSPDDTITASLDAGTTYFVYVDGYSSGSGPFTLKVSEPCIPQCDGKQCGDDGCGTTCGTCDAGFACQADGTCLDMSTMPGNVCANPIVVDASSYPVSVAGDTTNMTNDFTAPGDVCEGISSNKGGGSPDMVFSFTPTDAGAYTIRRVSGDTSWDGAIYVGTTCDDIATTCLAANDTYGSDDEVTVSLDAGSTYFIYVDGWSNSSSQSGAFTLEIDAPCIPDCTNKDCGSDGCGGTCGTPCTDPQVCDAMSFTCVDAANAAGNTCTAPVPLDISTLPSTSPEYDTSGLTNDFAAPANVCDGLTTSDKGTNAPDMVFSLTPDTAGIYTISLVSDWDGIIYLATTCDDVANTCVVYGDSSPDDTITASLDAGTTYFVYVDGWSSGSGPFSVKVSEPCLPSCDGKTCGADGCGGTCGTCTDPQICDTTAGQCVDPASLPGNTCAAPMGLAPASSFDGDTTGLTNDFGAADGECPGLSTAKGQGSNDMVFRFTAPATAVYTFQLDAAFSGALYAMSDCADVTNTCLGGSTTSGGVAELTLSLTEGQLYFIVVDGSYNISNESGTFTLTASAACTPDCTGKECGPDGCGLDCGTCTDPLFCDQSNGLCVDPATIEGNTCGAPYVVAPADLPFTATGDTSTMTGEYGYSDGACPGESSGWGAGSNDVVYSFTAAADGTYRATLSNDGFDSNLYAVTDCAAIDTTCKAASESFGPESIDVQLTAGETVFFICDGYGNTSNQSGSYTFTLELLP